MNVYEIITKQIIDKLEKGVIPWRKPWKGYNALPKNIVTGKTYQGINVMLLLMQGYSNPYWLTFKQASQLGGYIRKGETSTMITFYKNYEKENKQTGEKEKHFALRYYRVFNYDQTENIPLPDDCKIETIDFNPIDEAEKIVSNMPNKPIIIHHEARAYYIPSQDKINMPKQNTFNSSEEYYSTLFHELGHSTGHKSRLDREALQKNHMFGSKDYSKEELIAEITSAFLCGVSGIINKTIDNSTAYINGWLKRLKEDSRFIFTSASQAQKASNYILNITE